VRFSCFPLFFAARAGVWTLASQTGQRQTYSVTAELYGSGSKEQQAVSEGWSEVGLGINIKEKKRKRK
jgi:hypothetical protein